MSLRFKLVAAAAAVSPYKVKLPKERPSDYFAKNVFNQEKMFHYLTPEAYNTYCDALEQGKPLDRQSADAIARGMKQWAMERGVTHCTHWFQPLTGGTAEKHDNFLVHAGRGRMIEEFTGKMLLQQEPDASSFPSGGIRSTFEARGYSAWDPASPVFIVDDTLMIPTIFIAYTGEALDYKAPLKKSLAAIDVAATRVAQRFDREVHRVTTNLGWEQEYFLIDAELMSGRPDLLITGRTLMGHDAAKTQQMDDHYFGAIPERVVDFMRDLEVEALALGIPCKTRHNEVAPNQFELAPIFEECNLAVDHNMLLMLVMRRIAEKHGLCCLLHEKPFKGVNGSGKHENWSLQTNTGVGLLSPGKTARENLRFAVFVVETLKGVYRHNGLLKASVMTAGNQHRLGGDEAPPAIISAFLGQEVENLIEHIYNLDHDDLLMMADKREMRIDVPQVPDVMIDNTDRNRTSPFAFTGNRFEFRAVGSSENCSGALIVLNTAVAEALTEFDARVDALIKEGKEEMQAIVEVLRADIPEIRPLCFSGNGYSEAWRQEAQKRGLSVETSCPLTYDYYMREESIKMFEDMRVMDRHELLARNEIKWDIYRKKIQIEARVVGDLCTNHIVPAAIRYESLLLDNVAKMRSIYESSQSERYSSYKLLLLQQLEEHIQSITEGAEEMRIERKKANGIANIRERAVVYHDEIVPRLEAIRKHVDKLEMLVEDELWPLPKYRELLYI